MELDDKNGDGSQESPDEIEPTSIVTNKKQRKKAKRVAKARSKTAFNRLQRPYPRVSLEQALRIPTALKEKNVGNPWPPEDVAKAVGLSKNNPDFFYLAAAARDFGFTDGSRDSQEIKFTDFGRQTVYADSEEDEDLRLREALLKVDIFKKVLEYYKGSNLPEMKYLGNTLTREFNLDSAYHEEFSKQFKENCDFLKIGSGFTPDVDISRSVNGAKSDAARWDSSSSTVVLAEPEKNTGLRCFVAMPFRERETGRPDGFFDEVLGALIAPAGRDAGFEVLTANRDGSDVIQATTVNQLLDADLVIADLTENNPNVLFELGLRIAEDKPVALIRAKGTPAIFDVDNMLRVFEHDPNLWKSTVENDCARLLDHIKATWANRKTSLTYIGILRERRSAATSVSKSATGRHALKA
jgi:hypothetical protein